MNFDGFTAHKLGDLSKLLDEKMDKWLETRRIGIAEYDPEVNAINLHVYSGSNVYQVDLDRCKTQKEFVDWIIHLSGKTWCKGSVLTDFVHCLEWAIRERDDEDLYTFFQLNK